MTETDIPPGGEGAIEVSFDSSHKKGKQKKSITVESNDPVNPKTTLNISVLIEVDFDFETSDLNMGRIRKGKPATKTAVLLIKEPSKRNLLEFSSTSPRIAARIVETSGGDEGRIDVEVTVAPEIAPGKLNAMIIAKLSDGSYPAAKLQINGTVTGNVEITPETVRFTADTSRTASDQAEQEVQVISTQDESKMQLLGVEDSRNFLAIEIDTVAAGKQYVIRTRPNENALKLGRNASGEIKIQTDDAEQPEITVRYSIIFPQ